VTAPKPEDFERLLDQVLGQAARWRTDLAKEYRWAYGASHERVVREGVGRSSGPSDPTASVVGDPRPGANRIAGQAAIRRVLEQAPRRVIEAENALKALEKQLVGVMDRLDPREGFEQLRYPRTASESDLTDAKEAQRRRETRGEHVP
jgi:hypothetical protein